MTVATIGHMACVWLLLVPIAATGLMASDDRCYCGARGTCAISINTYNSDGPSDISGPLLLPPTVVIGYMTSDDSCYCWAHGMRVVATSPHSSDGNSDINCLPPLAPTVATS
jgi:hypothetical protein